MTFLTPEVLQPPPNARMAQLAQRLVLNLANALAGDAKAPADVIQRAVEPVDQPKAQREHAPLPRSESAEDVLDLDPPHADQGGLDRRGRLLVLDEVAQGSLVLDTDGHL